MTLLKWFGDQHLSSSSAVEVYGRP